MLNLWDTAVEDLEPISKCIITCSLWGVYDFYQGTDIVLLLNVIHHLGDDFGDKSLLWKKAKEKMKASINYF
jgi:hypothetical protein